LSARNELQIGSSLSIDKGHHKNVILAKVGTYQTLARPRPASLNV